MSQPFYTLGLKFTCKKCSRCCRYEPGYVYLSETDLTKLLSQCNLDREAFIQQYCRWVPDWEGDKILALKETADYDCILWNQGCTVYDARPVQCVSYPFWTSLLKSADAWNAGALECPGINQGERRGFEHIQERLAEYAGNVPVKRGKP
jgi:Fe-S-cluster containining protein